MSEVVGNLLILMITVALFGVVLGFIYSIPGPSPTLQAEIVPMLERTSSVDATLYLQHTGGEDLKEGAVYIVVSINDVPKPAFKISDGLGGKTVMQPGDVWTMSFVGTVPTSAKIDVRIVDKVGNNMLFYTVVQRGFTSGGNHDPIIAYAWVHTTSGGDIIPNNDYTTFRIYAVCKDLDGNLPPTGSVTVAVTSVDNGDGTASITAIGAGATDMSDMKGDGVFMSGLLKVKNTVVPGDYTFTVTAKDDTGRTATATVKITISTSTSIIKLEGSSVAPPLVKSGDVNDQFLKLTFTAIGESIHVTGIRVSKLGTIPDASVTVYVYWDKNGNGVLDLGTDLNMPGFGTFAGGLRDFTSTPLFTAIQDTPTICWVVVSIGGGTEGSSIGVSIAAQANVNAIGVSTPIRILPIGSFPINSDVRTVKGVFKIYGDYEMPSKILTNTNNVKILRLQFVATGETVYIQNLNITLTGTIAPDQAQIWLKDMFGTVLTAPTAFDLMSRRASFTVGPPGWKVDKSWASYDIYCYLNIQGAAGNTVGLKVEDTTQCWAETEISLDFVNPASPAIPPIPIPFPQDTRVLQLQGTVTIQNMGSTAMPVRAGGTDMQQNYYILRCYGEPVQFFSFNFTLMGTIPYDKVVSIRVVANTGYPTAIAYDKTLAFNSAKWVKFADAIPTVPLFTVDIDTNFYGYVYVYYYVSIAHGQEGQSIQTSLDNAAKIACKGQVTGNSITVTNYDGASVFPNRGASRIVNGQLYVYRTSLIPSPLVDSSQNVPVMKLTFKCEGQRVHIMAIIIRKLGTVAQNQITVRIYWDQSNDTFNKLNGDDFELDITHSGNFVGNQITFNPDIWVNIGTDYNIIIAYSLGLGTAGWTCGCSVSALEITAVTDAPNGQNAFPNQCLNAARNPPIAMITPTVNIKDRGTLTVDSEDLSPANVHRYNSYFWMKLTFWAEGESVNVNRIVFMMQNITAGEAPDSYEDISIFICWDKNNNSAYEFATDGWIANWQNLDSNGRTTFLAFPLFEVKPRTPFNLLIKVYFGDNVAPSRLQMIINDTSCIQSGGQTSGQSITPIASFPITTAERRIRM